MFIVKFVHMLFALSLIIMTMYLIVKAGSPTKIHKGILVTGFFAMLTGTLLVLPKHYTFHTPWIQAAYILLLFFCIAIVLFKKLPAHYRWLTRGSYTFLLFILIAIVHDAVTKTTFIF